MLKRIENFTSLVPLVGIYFDTTIPLDLVSLLYHIAARGMCLNEFFTTPSQIVSQMQFWVNVTICRPLQNRDQKLEFNPIFIMICVY